MEKILRWWTEFLLQLEAGKRVIAIFIIITAVLTYALIVAVGKLDKARVEATRNEKINGEQIARLKDSTAVIISRLTNYYNEKTENIYKEQLEAINEVEKGYKIIKKSNDKIISKAINR